VFYQVKNDSLYTKEFYMYGSQRLGYLEHDVFLGRKCIGKFCNIVANPVNPMPFIGTQKTLPTLPPVVIQPISSSSVSVVFGKKRYEISDWLGNARVVINDRKTPVNIGATTMGYKAQVINVNDYYSFGSEINERTYTYNTPYRFSFNGKEDIRDQRWYQDYGARWYNKVLGRFISADPIIITEKKYPWYSSYQFAGNKPINYIDLDGKEEAKFDYPWSPQFIGGQNMDEADKRTYFNSMMSTVASGLLLFNPIEDAAIGFMAAKSLDFLKLVGKSINYAIRYENVVIKTAESVNQEFRFARGIGKSKETYDAYKKGTYVIEFTTRKEEQFVRVFKEGSKSGPKGSWMMKKSELYDESGKMLSPEQIKNKFSLKDVPDSYVEVNIPAGTRMRFGEAAEVEKLGTSGGGKQFQSLQEIPKSSYSRPKKLSEMK